MVARIASMFFSPDFRKLLKKASDFEIRSLKRCVSYVMFLIYHIYPEYNLFYIKHSSAFLNNNSSLVFLTLVTLVLINNALWVGEKVA